jgi:dTDP-4-dehydrorhamnose reductase
MKALVLGAGGQLGQALVAHPPTGWRVVGLARSELDIGDREAVFAAVAAQAPDLILNAAAYTAVDRAESEATAAFRINRDGAGHVAAAAARQKARLVHVSTDFVFDGEAGRPYAPAHPTRPIGVYGLSKRDGEQAVSAALPGAVILRTAWVYSATGANFLKTMLRLMESREEVRVVADQVGTPTAVPSLARAVWAFGQGDASGFWHYTDAGVASWYDFAQAIAEEALAAGVLHKAARVSPIGTVDYPTPAARPSYSVLDKSAAFTWLGGPAPHWRDSLRDVIRSLKATS